MRAPILRAQDMVDVDRIAATGRDGRGLIRPPQPVRLGSALVAPLSSPETTGDASEANEKRIQANFPRQQLTVASTDQVEIRAGAYAGVYDIVEEPGVWPRGTVLTLRRAR